jgi:hypothetical protein
MTKIAKRIVDRKDHATVLFSLAKKLRFAAMVPAYAPVARPIEPTSPNRAVVALFC